MQRILSLVILATLILGYPTPTSAEDAASVAARIDALLQADWQREGIEAAPTASDQEFLRRVYLDLVGVIPPVSAIRKFEADQDPEKRKRVVDQLLDSPRHATHLANTWRRILLPDGFPAERSGDAVGMQQWLRDRFVQNVRYDRIVGDFITATGSAEAGPVLFYQALEVQPEKLAASTARSFLGIQIQCAQCHDHPFDDWTQKNFWEYAAFFAQVTGSQSMNNSAYGFQLQDASTGDVTLPEEDEVIPPAFPGADQPDADPDSARRLQLSIWLSSGNNPYLATATANRVWSLLFGLGIVEPVDDISELNAPSHPEVLQTLADAFIDSEFNLKELFRTVAYTRAYELTSRSTEGNRPPETSFAVMSLKNLTAEQVFDSLSQCLQYNPELTAGDVPTNSLENPVRREFLVKMASEAHRPTQYSAGLQQTLHMMNNPQLAQITGGDEHGLLAALQAPFFTDPQRVETIFMAALGREPAENERSLFVEHLASAEDENKTAAMADLLWALINSAEFRLNH